MFVHSGIRSEEISFPYRWGRGSEVQLVPNGRSRNRNFEPGSRCLTILLRLNLHIRDYHTGVRGGWPGTPH